MKNKILSIIILTAFSNQIQSQEDSTKIPTFEPTLSYTCDAGRNFSGGIKTGNGCMGMVNAGVLIHTDNLWQGGEFYAEIKNTHGYNLSENYIGDMQVASNIENGNFTFLSQLYYKQTIDKFSVLTGVHDLNTEFVISDLAGALTNSSFGISSTFPLNFPVSIYPKPALALIASYNFNENFSFRTALYDGDAGSLDDDPHNLDFSISSEQGFLSINEITYSSTNGLTTVLKLGGYYHTSEFGSLSDSIGVEKGNYGFYAIVDKGVYENGDRKIGIFGQLGLAPSDANFNKAYVGAGINCCGLFANRADDCFAVGMAYARTFDKKYECDLECNYNFSVNKYINIQPCIHYILNPGANAGLDNAFAGFLRANIGF
jgi:porin